MVGYSLGDLEDPEQPEGPESGEAEAAGALVVVHPHHLEHGPGGVAKKKKSSTV